MLEGGEQAKRTELKGKKPTDNICFFLRNLTFLAPAEERDCWKNRWVLWRRKRGQVVTSVMSELEKRLKIFVFFRNLTKVAAASRWVGRSDGSSKEGERGRWLRTASTVFVFVFFSF